MMDSIHGLSESGTSEGKEINILASLSHQLAADHIEVIETKEKYADLCRQKVECQEKLRKATYRLKHVEKGRDVARVAYSEMVKTKKSMHQALEEGYKARQELNNQIFLLSQKVADEDAKQNKILKTYLQKLEQTQKEFKETHRVKVLESLRSKNEAIKNNILKLEKIQQKVKNECENMLKDKKKELEDNIVEFADWFARYQKSEKRKELEKLLSEHREKLRELRGKDIVFPAMFDKQEEEKDDVLFVDLSLNDPAELDDELDESLVSEETKTRNIEMTNDTLWSQSSMESYTNHDMNYNFMSQALTLTQGQTQPSQESVDRVCESQTRQTQDEDLEVVGQQVEEEEEEVEHDEETMEVVENDEGETTEAEAPVAEDENSNENEMSDCNDSTAYQDMESYIEADDSHAEALAEPTSSPPLPPTVEEQQGTNLSFMSATANKKSEFSFTFGGAQEKPKSGFFNLF